MKKIFAVLLAFVLCFAGCSGEDEFVPERGKVENGIYKNSFSNFTEKDYITLHGFGKQRLFLKTL